MCGDPCGQLLEDAELHLAAYGYNDITGANLITLRNIVKRTVPSICNQCNVPEMPGGLYYVALDRICGQYLQQDIGCMQMNTEGTDRPVQSISEGDTSITFSSDMSRAEALLQQLLTSGEDEIAKYKRLAW